MKFTYKNYIIHYHKVNNIFNDKTHNKYNINAITPKNTNNHYINCSLLYLYFDSVEELKKEVEKVLK